MSQWRRHYRLCLGHCVHRVGSIFNYVSILLCFSSFWFWHTLCTIYQHILYHICAVNLNDLVKKKNYTKLLIAFILQRFESLFCFFCHLRSLKGATNELVDSNVTLIFYFDFQGFLCVIIWLNQSPESCTFTPVFTVSSHSSLLGTTVWLWTEDSRVFGFHHSFRGCDVGCFEWEVEQGYRHMFSLYRRSLITSRRVHFIMELKKTTFVW